MNGARRNTLDTSHSNEPPRFPLEAYDYNEDVTPGAVEKMRLRSAEQVESEEWELIDGLVV